MPIHESGEDYLESILKLRQQGKAVRSIDVVADLGYSKPSVSVGMKRLREAGYITVDKDGILSLTESGETVARRIISRHRTLTEFFIRLGVSPEVAERDACKVEHDLSDETFEKLVAHAAQGEAT
ncbi:MAG: metal-dependent transcriptional regulator [Oscillospiraceae bacterium]